MWPNSVRTKTIELPMGPLTVREVGEGPPLVFLHPVLATGALWRDVALALSDDHRCVLPDLPLGAQAAAVHPDADLTPPGQAQVVADLLEALDLEDVTLIGSDTGGAIAQLVVTRHPARISRLVLLPCDAFDNFPPPLFAPLKTVTRIPGGLWALLGALRSTRISRLPIAFGWLSRRPIDPQVLRSFLEPPLRDRAVRRDLHKALSGIDARHTLAAADALPGFDRPTLLVWAEEDRVFPVDHAHRLAALLPDARVVSVDDSYSFVMVDQPERVVDEVRRFVAATSQVAPRSA